MTISSLSLKKAHKDFLEFLKDKGRASATILAYGSDLEQLVQFCLKNGKINVNDICKNDL